MKLIPILPPELDEDIDELVALARENREFATAVLELLKHGLPLLVADTDSLTTTPTGARAFTFQLPDRLKDLMATFH